MHTLLVSGFIKLVQGTPRHLITFQDISRYTVGRLDFMNARKCRRAMGGCPSNVLPLGVVGADAASRPSPVQSIPEERHIPRRQFQ